MKLTELVEQTDWNLSQDSQTLHNVCLLSKTSKNGRTYTPQALKDAARLFEGSRIFEMHTEGSTPRKPRDYIGTISGCYVKDNKVYAKDMNIINESMWGTLKGIAKHDPKCVGLSIEGKGTVDKNKQVVSMQEGGRVALVCNPAATSSLFESETKDKDTDMELKEQLDQATTELETLKATNKELMSVVEALANDVLPSSLVGIIGKLEAKEAQVLIEEFKKNKNISKPKSDSKTDVKSANTLQDNLLAAFN